MGQNLWNSHIRLGEHTSINQYGNHLYMGKYPKLYGTHFPIFSPYGMYLLLGEQLYW